MAIKRLYFYTVPVILAVCQISQAATVILETTTISDTFVRQNTPDENFASKGALSVAGSAAGNTSGELVGPADAFLRFNVASEVASLDAELGSHNWAISNVYMKVVEQTMPGNPRFGRGQGRFEIRWIAADNWPEAELTWNTKGIYLNSDTDLSIGIFTNLYHGDAYFPIQRFSLSLPEALVNDIRSGDDVSFYLTALDPSIGFTFNSRDITGTRPPPCLEIVAAVYNKADLNHDGCADFLDYAKLAGHWQETGSGLDGDVNEDGIVDYEDLEMLADNWLAHDP
jgi:hypothetical protein